MRDVGANLGIPVHVFGPETHMTAVVGMALGKRPIPSEAVVEFSTANFLLPGGQEDEVCHLMICTRRISLIHQLILTVAKSAGGFPGLWCR